MAKRIVVFASLFILFVSLSGCATGRRERELELQRLRNQITVLETQVQTKEDEINSLRESISRQPEEKKIEAKSRPNTKQIQIALKNAGFDPGAIDGKKGRKTVEAIKLFQKANNLSADGKVGKATWDLLKEYLYKKVK